MTDDIYGHNKTTKKKKAWDVKEAKTLPETAALQRVDLRVEDFDRLIEQKGVQVCVYRTSYCPNVKSVDGAEHEVDCPLCNGSGFIDRHPILVKAFIQNQELEQLLSSADIKVDGNHVLMTFPVGVELQYFTKIELKDFTEIYFERVMRRPGSDTDVLKFKACRVNMLIDSDGNDYYQNQDFKIDANGNIKWIDRTPPVGKIFTINYESHVQFRAVRAMHVNRFTQYKKQGSHDVEHIKLPVQWMCAKEFLVRRKDNISGQDLPQNPYDMHIDGTGNNN